MWKTTTETTWQLSLLDKVQSFEFIDHFKKTFFAIFEIFFKMFSSFF